MDYQQEQMLIKDKIKVLIIDDAMFMRKAIADILESDPSLEVIGTAKDGLDGLEKIKALGPDVVTLDIDMPRMDGLTAIRHIMIESPVPVVVLSSLFSDGAVTFEALRLGVVDFVPKPSGAVSVDIEQARQQIIDRVKIASGVNLFNIRRVKLEPGLLESWEEGTKKWGSLPLEYLITIGTSLGGPNTVIRLLSRLVPAVPAAIVVVQEIAPRLLPAFVEKFDQYVAWNIQAAGDGVQLEQGCCYISSNQVGTSIVRSDDDGKAVLKLSSKVDQPLNRIFNSAVDLFGDKTIGLLLTGVGDDGAAGFERIKQEGGTTIAQDTQCCVYPNLTDNAIEKGTVMKIVSENRLPQTLESLTGLAAI